MTEVTNTELLASLRSDDPRTQILATRRCARLKPMALLDALLALGESPDAEVRAAAYWAIDQMRVATAIPRLVRALHDPDFVARSNAGWALVNLGEAVITPVNAVAALSRNADAREMAWLVLERVRRSTFAA